MATLISTPLYRDAALKAFQESSYAQQAYRSTSPSSDADSDVSIGCDDTSLEISPAKKAFTPIKDLIGQLDTASTSVLAAAASTQPITKYSAAARIDFFTAAVAFLPLDDINVVRQCGGALAEAAERVAPQPLATKEATFVRWQPSPLLEDTRRVGSHVFQWRCLACGSLTFSPRTCNGCKSQISHSACRVFMGQLRKDLTADLTAYLIRSVLPDVTVLHIESHTNVNDQRGKGCAWIYVNSIEDAVRVTELHKRVFIDIDGNQNEGFWVVKNDTAAMDRLCQMAATLGAARGRPAVLPRQAVVAELPGTSMLSQYLQKSA